MNIWIAAADNNVTKVTEYLESGKFTPNSKDANGYTPIHAAAEYGHLDLLSLLIEKGGDVNVTDNDGDTPLHACEQVKVAEALVKLGAKLDTTNDEGFTPLQKAEDDGDFPELIAFLRKQSGIEDTADEQLPDNVQFTVRAETQEELPPTQVTEEQRAELSQIIESGTDADFETYLKNVIGQSEDPAKKAKKD